ncbi:MAG: hypothetical protein ACT4PT_03200 [Methanobacteriota archaeon]
MASIREYLLPLGIIFAIAVAGVVPPPPARAPEPSEPEVAGSELELPFEDVREPTRTWIVRIPPNVTEGTDAFACWRVEGEGNVSETAVLYDDESHDGPDASPDDYADAALPGGEPAHPEDGYRIPGTFCTLVPMAAEGDLFVRAFATEDEESTGRVSDEHRIARTSLPAAPPSPPPTTNTTDPTPAPEPTQAPPPEPAPTNDPEPATPSPVPTNDTATNETATNETATSETSPATDANSRDERGPAEQPPEENEGETWWDYLLPTRKKEKPP